MRMRKLLCIICLTVLLAGCASADEIRGASTATLSKTSASWDGQNLPDYAPGKPEITILRITIPPGSQLPVHKHPVINAGVLLSGELTVMSEDGKVLRLKAGESIVELVNTWHYGKNDGEIPVELIMFYAGKVGVPITVYQSSSTDAQPSRAVPEAARAR